MGEEVKLDFSKKIKRDILNILKTKQNANEFVEFIHFLSNETFSTDKFDVFAAVTEKYGDKRPGWFDSLQKNLPKDLDIKYVRECLNGLEMVVDGAEIVKIEMPFVPSNSFINDLYKLLGQSKTGGASKGKFLIDVEVNESLIGGAKIYVGGKYINLTLNQMILSYLETNDAIKRYL